MPGDRVAATTSEKFCVHVRYASRSMIEDSLRDCRHESSYNVLDLARSDRYLSQVGRTKIQVRCQISE